MATLVARGGNHASDLINRFVTELTSDTAAFDATPEKARESLFEYARYTSGGFYQRAPHIDLLISELEAVERGEIDRLMVFMPPRHSKSFTTSHKFPSWYLGRNPHKRVILASYGSSLADDAGRLNRNDLEQHGREIFGVGIAGDSKSANRWNIAGHRGGMVTVGVGGPATGRGAHLFIVDDPFKDYEEANSETIRERVWNWYRAVAYTRLQKGGAIILIQTRWHEDDLAGRLLKEMKNGGDQWRIVQLPALAEENDPLGRKPGEPLWPEGGFDAAWAERTKRTVGSYVWSALYQQRPQPAEGGLFKRQWFRYFHRDGDDWYVLRDPDGHRRISRHHCWRFATVDVAASLKQTADYTAAATWAVTPQSDLILLDMVRIRLEGPDQRQMIRDLFARHQPSFIGIERTGYQLTLIQELLREGLPIRELRPDGDKYARALVASARYEAGTVYHPATASWLGDFEDELLQFPNAAHDDMVDTVSYAAKVLADGGQHSRGTVATARRGRII